MEREEKLLRFRSIILSEVSQRCREIDSELQASRRQELERAENAILQDSYRRIQKEVGEVAAQTTKTVSRMRMEKKRTLYARREEYVAGIFKEARKRLAEFAQTPAYKDYLLETVRTLGTRSAQRAVLLVNERDLALREELMQAYGHACEVRQSAQIELGGVIAEYTESASVADESLESALKAQREWLCGQADFVVAL